jgi:NAD(P)-dependent dehydrogenase (short-subunit alcohol dehydrogenase family)
MDLGISGRQALVCGASRGLGFACAAALARIPKPAWSAYTAMNPGNLTAPLSKVAVALHPKARCRAPIKQSAN